MDDTLFVALEQLNAQVDVWIDQEQFELVSNAFRYGSFETAPKQISGNEKRLNKAFSQNQCAYHLKKEWIELLNISSPPLEEFRLLGNSWIPFSKEEGKNAFDKRWIWFFWSKLIRAKIQQKGSDCYFNKLDQLVFFLERNLPNVSDFSHQSNKLAVIYLLEMAAAGLGADQRSFAERARRILSEYFNRKSDGSDYFNTFYDLLARYNIALGYSHEGNNRMAIREFNFIIKNLRSFWDKDGRVSPSPNLGNLVQYVDERHGLEFIYLPAVLGRASIENKLQLAYHALYTVDKYWRKPKNPYLMAKKECLLAEANRLMGHYKSSETNLRTVYNILMNECPAELLLKNKASTEWTDQIENLISKSGQIWANIQGRLIDTLVALHLDKLKGQPSAVRATSLEKISKLFKMYWEVSKWQSTNRTGYFELLSAYLGWIPGRKCIRKYKRLVAEKLYQENFEIFRFPDKKEAPSDHICPICTQIDINLERLESAHYHEFIKNMLTFYSESKIEVDSQRFRKYVFNVEKDNKEDSAYQKRVLALDNLGVYKGPKSWCKRCIGDKAALASDSFLGLLSCANSYKKSNALNQLVARFLRIDISHWKNIGNICNQEGSPLDSRHYEHLMDNWDRRFLNHLEIKSVHPPRCKALHLLGLQRWNSTSPAIGRSLGGGYLIYHTKKNGEVDLGVAIDPGFDFVRNLFHLGFSLFDIDIVLLSHAHLDHIRDFESLVTLCLELKKRHPSKMKRRLHAIMTLGVYRRLSHIFDSTGLREFVEPYILDIEKEIDPKFIKPYISELNYYNTLSNHDVKGSNNIDDLNKHEFIFQEIQNNGEDNNIRGFRFAAKTPSEDNNCNGLHLSVVATRAYHNDFSEYSDSFGFKIKISFPIRESKACTIGYTGDTSWSPDIINQYSKCDALLVHLGSLIDRDKDICFENYMEDGKKCWELIKDKNHPYLFGLLRFLTEIANLKSSKSGKVPLVLLSEFGEELRGRIRLDLWNRLSAHYNGKNTLRKIHLLPLDVGLDVLLCIDDCTERKSEPDALKRKKRHGDYDRLRKLLNKNDLKKDDSSFFVKCSMCEEFVVIKQVDFVTYGIDEGLYCVCKACRRSTPQNVLQDKLRDLYEIARPLQGNH